MSPGALTWIFIAFLSGSLPFSVWIGRFGLRADIRSYGDGNPGPANVWRAGGRFWSVAAVFLDFLKGALPVSWVHFGLGFTGLALVLVALAPILGHAFSPFLKWHGGKALAVTFGVWTGLSLWWAPLLLGGLFAFWLRVVTVEGWAVILGMVCLFVILIVVGVAGDWLLIWLGNFVILAWKHRADLAR